MKNFVTFCVQGPEAGANPLGHSCLLLSQYNEKASEQRIKVVSTYGFYGLPSTASKDSIIRKLKIRAGLDTDFSGSHGMLRHEDMRYLDLGKGLRGVTFELTQEQFDRLQTACSTMILGQKEAIAELVESEGIKSKSQDQTRIYPQEAMGPFIYQSELKKAKDKGEAPRLKPFEARFRFGLKGPDITQSHNCKSQALELLATVLTPRQIARLSENNNHPTIPLYSGRMESIHLFSTGNVETHQKASGELLCYRTGADAELWFAIPPQECEFISDETKALLTIDQAYIQQIKIAVTKLQALEWFVHAAQVQEEFLSLKKTLISEITGCYQSFASIDLKSIELAIHPWVVGFFSVLNSEVQNNTKIKLQQAHALFSSLSFAISDEWEKPEEGGVGAGLSYLTLADQKKICEIIGQTYSQPYSLVTNLYEKQCREYAEPVLTKLRQLVWCLQHAKVGDQHEASKMILLDRVIEYKDTLEKLLLDVQDYALIPDKSILLNKVGACRTLIDDEIHPLFDGLVSAIADKWEEEIEAVAGHFLVKDQMKIRNILGRVHCKPIELNHTEQTLRM